MALGELNASALFNYNVVPQDLTDLQNYSFEQLRNLLKEKWSQGVISGCSVTPGTGLDIKVSPGLLMLPNGVLAYVLEETTVALEAADAVNPRIDRIEAEFETINGRTGVNEEGATVVVVKLHKATSSSKQGVAAATPVAPAKSSGKVSLGTVYIAPLSTTVAISDIDQSIRFRDVSIEFNAPIKPLIANNQVAEADLPNVSADKSQYRVVSYEGQIYRKDNVKSASAHLKILLTLNESTDEWVFSYEIDGEEDIGVELSFDQDTQKVKYTSDDYPNGGYQGEMNLNLNCIKR